MADHFSHQKSKLDPLGYGRVSKINPTDEFSTYIFKENKIKTNNLKVAKERPFYVGALILLISIVLLLLDIEYVSPFLVVGYILFFIGRATMSGLRPSVGHRPLTLKLTADSVFIGKER